MATLRHSNRSFIFLLEHKSLGFKELFLSRSQNKYNLHQPYWLLNNSYGFWSIKDLIK